MKRFSFLLSVLTLFVIISCSSDDDNYESKLSGKWVCKSASTTVIDLTTNEEVQGPFIGVIEDGSMLYFYDEGRLRYEWQGITSNSDYKLSDNNIEFYIEGGRCKYRIDEITSSRLSLYREDYYQKNNRKLINKAQFEKTY